MAHQSNIEWTEATWNPWHGCHKVSQGCKNCYMFRDKARYGQDPNIVTRSKDATFYAPLKWNEPRTIFTCSWSDFFIEEADPWRDEAFGVMEMTPQHTYQVLTKRPDRMLDYIRDPQTPLRIAQRIEHPNSITWPLPNVLLGVSVEDRDTYLHRVPYLALTPGAVKFLSIEPLLGDLGDLMLDGIFEGIYHWAIVGGESCPDARPMHGQWAIEIQQQCSATGVPFFFKQWGEWMPLISADEASRFKHAKMHEFEDGLRMVMVGKKRAGRLLDGREWNEMPEVSK